MPNEAPKEPGAESYANQRKEAAQPADLIAEINNLSRTVKTLEDKSLNLRKKVQLDEQNSLTAHRKFFDDIKFINSDVLEIKREIEDLKDKIKLIIKELKLTAKSEQLQELQKYIEIWEPVNFVTRNEVQKIVERMMEQKFGG